MEAQCDKCEYFIKMLHSAQSDRLQLSKEIKRLKSTLHRIADPEDNADYQLIAEKALAESV